MSHLEGESREQATLLPAVLDDYVGAEDPVRVVDAFVDGLELSALGFSRVVAAATGRPGYAPGSLLKLYIYGYLNQVRSSRRLARECERNVEVMWLLRRLSPSFKTIADFRRDHGRAIVAVCRSFTRFCREQGLFSAHLVAIDGTKIGSVASRKRVMTPARVAKEQARLEARIEDYLQAMDQVDAEEAAASAEAQEVRAALEQLKARREELQSIAQQMQDAGHRQRVEGEPEAKLMRGPRGHLTAYNAQIAVDEKHHLIVAAEVTSEGNDHRQLLPMSEAAKQALAVESLTVVADKGYANGEQGRACAERGITACVPRPAVVNPVGKFFTRERFTYEAASDSYRCPAGESLPRRRTSHTKQQQEYWSKACGGCAVKGECTARQQRVIVRSFFEADLEAMGERARSNPQWMRQRHCLAEHPFGTMKALMGVPRFLVRGLAKARGEFGLSVLAYNLKRVIRVLGVATLLARLAAWRFEVPETAPA